MAANLGIGVLVGTIPILGDIFDIAWKANRRNYRLLRRHLGEPRRHTWRTGFFCFCLARDWRVVFAIPIVLVAVADRVAHAATEAADRAAIQRTAGT